MNCTLIMFCTMIYGCGGDFILLKSFVLLQVPFQVPLEVNVVLIGFNGDGGYRYNIDSHKLEEFLRVGFPSHRPSCLETGQPIDIEHHIVFNAFPVPINLSWIFVPLVYVVFDFVLVAVCLFILLKSQITKFPDTIFESVCLFRSFDMNIATKQSA